MNHAENRIELLHYDQQGKLTQREPVKTEELVDRLTEIGKRDRKTSVVIQADDKALHESVVAVIDAAYQANMEDVRIAQPVEVKGEKPAETPVAPKSGGPARKVKDK